jgi:hypothetical protein
MWFHHGLLDVPVPRNGAIELWKRLLSHPQPKAWNPFQSQAKFSPIISRPTSQSGLRYAMSAPVVAIVRVTLQAVFPRTDSTECR